MAHDPPRQHGIIRQLHPVAVGIRHRRETRHRPEMRNVCRGHHQPHARHGAHISEIADREARMRMRRAQEARGERAVRHHVRSVAPPARNKARVFEPADRLSHPELLRLHTITLARGSP